MRSVTFIYEYPPIPVRSCDWRACWTDDDECGPSGFGATKKAAFADLIINTEMKEELMAQYHHDTTWEVKTIDGSQTVVELDVRVEYDFEPTSKVIFVRDVKGLFRKHGSWITLEIPEELRILAIKHFEADAGGTFEEAVLIERDSQARDDAADAKADHLRERKED